MINHQNYKQYIRENLECFSLMNYEDDEPHTYFAFFTEYLYAFIDAKNTKCIVECFGLIEEILEGQDTILEDAITTTVFISLFGYFQNKLDITVFMGSLSKELYAKTIELWVSNQPK